MADLNTHIQALPQELQDHILEDTLIAGIELHHGPEPLIEPGYRPPWQLSINSRTRQTVTVWYYSTLAFRIDTPPGYNLFDLTVSWLRSLSDEMRKLLSDVRWGQSQPMDLKLLDDDQLPPSSRWLVEMRNVSRMLLEDLEGGFVKHGVQLRANVIKESCLILDDEGKRTMRWMSAGEIGLRDRCRGIDPRSDLKGTS